MAFAVAGMLADGETIVQDVECVRESYPGFEKVLDEFVSVKRTALTTPVISSLAPSKPPEE
jgi:3-phosphoshikimate 1-carboxyvinyltransferase